MIIQNSSGSEQVGADNNEDDDVDMDEESWSNLHDNIKFLQGTSKEFRQCSLFVSFGGQATTLMHRVCSLNPPVEVVRTLLA